MAADKAYASRQHIGLGRVTAVALAPDGHWLAVAVQRLDRAGAEYVSDLWKVPVDGDDAVRLTRGDNRDSNPCFRHDGALGFLSNRKPDDARSDELAEKRRQIWLLPPAGGEPYQLTDEPLGVDAFRFARSADRLLYTAPVLSDVDFDQQRETATDRAKHGPNARRFTAQPVRHWDHWLHENADMPNRHLIACSASAEQRVDLTPDATREFAIEPEFDVSADGRRAVISRASVGVDRELDTALLLVDLDAGTAGLLGAASQCNIEKPLFSPDGAHIAAVRSFRSAAAAPQPRLLLFTTESRAERELAGNWNCWPSLQDWCHDGSALLVSADQDGSTPLFRVDVEEDEVVRLSDPASGGHHGCCTALADGSVVGIRSSLLQAPEPFKLSGTAHSTPRCLANLSGLPPVDWVHTESITTLSTDGTPIQSWLMKPKGWDEPLPTLLWIHGGPMGMSGDLWHWRWNPLPFLARGYAVLQPNPRGSTGFGQDFIQGIWGNTWGGQCYEDLMAVTDAVSVRADIDGERIMAMGGSFGGYMTNWIGTQTDRYRCLITHASIVNMATFTGVTDHPAWWYLEMGGENPYQDPETFDRYAPWKYLANWKTPTLIIHGERDYRCPVGEALMLFEGLHYHGVDCELMLFPDECHFIEKPRNIVAWYDGIAEFLDRHMS